MNTRTTLVTLGVVAACAVPAANGTAHASVSRSSAATTVTIKAEGLDLSGRVKSTRRSCVTDRQVNLIKQIGTRGGGDDLKFASDLAGSDGSWETGNTGTSGRIYAKVKATTACQGDTSPTIRVRR